MFPCDPACCKFVLYMVLIFVHDKQFGPHLILLEVRQRRKEKESGAAKDIKITLKIQIEKNYGAAHKSTIRQRDYRGKKRILTAALSNGTHKSIIY